MARITLEIDDAVVPLVLAAIGYRAELVDGEGRVTPNPLTPMQHAQRWFVTTIKQAVRDYRALEAQKAAQAAIKAAIDAATAEAAGLGIT